jgi:hypothetical protein
MIDLRFVTSPEGGRTNTPLAGESSALPCLEDVMGKNKAGVFADER